MSIDEDLYSPEQLAKRLGVPVATVFKWNYLGTGPLPLHVGRHVRYRPSDVNDWLEERAAEARAR